jgi:hypothetical protein
MTLTGLAVSRLVGMMGPRVSAILKNLERINPGSWTAALMVPKDWSGPRDILLD